MTDNWVTMVDDETGEEWTFRWDFCAVCGCENRRSLRLASKYCHPHSMGMLPVSRELEAL